MARIISPSKTAVAHAAVLFLLVGCFALGGGRPFVEAANAASQYVVISSEPASDDFPAGKVLGVGDAIVVPENATLTLLGEDGSVVAIPGPAKVAVTEDALETTGETADQAEKNRSTLSKLATLLAGNRKNASSLGVSRGFNARLEVKGLANPWVLSIHESAQGCVLNEPIRLGRAKADKAISIEVEGEDKADKATLEWPEGEATIELPVKFKPDSKEILVRASGKTALINLNLVPEGINPDDPMAVLGWMVEEGCDSQALAFTRLLVHQAR
ncbi:MAG: hypothetical protein KDJ90_09900 [Nitratireductor sp.]|nr:hypothetical protein [Nitratireductor sp.]